MQSASSKNNVTLDEPASAPPGANEVRAAATTARICQAVITCLDRYGYAETSIKRVQATAGVSRGALTHHFPSKEELMVETLERLLDPVRGQPPAKNGAERNLLRSAGRGGGLESDLARLWTKVVNTREGRALLEILVAARTDTELRKRITPSLKAYNGEINHNILSLYRSSGPDGDDAARLWTICRAFLRGLHLHERFDDEPGATAAVIERFAQIMAPHMTALQSRKESEAGHAQSV